MGGMSDKQPTADSLTEYQLNTKLLYLVYVVLVRSSIEQNGIRSVYP